MEWWVEWSGVVSGWSGGWSGEWMEWSGVVDGVEWSGPGPSRGHKLEWDPATM